MTDWGGKVAAWFAAVTVGSATLAALVTQTAKPPLHGWSRAVFVILVIIAALSFVVLMLTGPRAVWLAWTARREAFKVQVIAAVRDQVTAEVISSLKDEIFKEFATQVTQPGHVPSASAILAASRASTGTGADPGSELRRILLDGRIIQARFREWGSTNVELPGDLAVELGQWEARAKTALVDSPDRLREFRDAPGWEIGLSTGEALRRTEHQMNAVENALQDIQQSGKRRKY